MAEPAKAASRASGVAVLFGGSVLLAKRSEKCYITGSPSVLGGYWSIFAGSIDPGETAKESAGRELYEESKIFTDFKNLQFYKSIKDDLCEFYIYIYKADRLLIPELSKEHTEYGWFSIQDLDIYPDPMDKKLKNCLKSIKNNS
jgi:8-oxo-dGTP pyrophosphatase MutT (NUDIX family)